MTFTERIENLEKIKIFVVEKLKMDEKEEGKIYLNSDILWIEYDWAALCYEEDILCLSFNIDADPTFAATLTKELVDGGYKPEIFEPYYIGNDGDLYWGEDLWKAKEKDLRSHYCN